MRDAIDGLAQAARDRDAAAVAAWLSPDFRAADGSNRAGAEANVRRIFAGYADLSVTAREVVIERSEGSAIARFHVDMSGRPRAIGGLEGILPRSSAWRFELRLVPGKNRWQVTWASWNEAER